MFHLGFKTKITMIIFIYFLLLGNLTQTIDMNIFSEGNEDTLQDHCLKTLRNSNSILNASEEVRANIADTLTGFTGGFLKNNGQKNDAMHYYAESSQMAVGFGTSEIRFRMAIPKTKPPTPNDPLRVDLIEEKVFYSTIGLEFLRSNEVIPVAKEPTGAFSHFFIGSEESKWSTSQYYTKVIYQNLYERIDLVYELKDGHLKYDFFVNPGGNPNDIKLHWTGPISLELVENGIKVKTHLVESSDSAFASDVSFVDTSPICYQSLDYKQAIKSSFKLLDSTTYGFSVPSYDPKKLLIIDPLVLTYSTYVGGNEYDSADDIAVDSRGNAYVTGHTTSTDFPTVNEYETDDSTTDAFVFKLAADGSSLVYSTYVGGSDVDFGAGIALDNAGNAYVTGYTYSTDFPTVNAFETDDGFHDAFVFKLASDGSSLEYSTYVGGSNEDFGLDIAVDSIGNAYVIGQTYSTNFPTMNAYNATGDGNTSYTDVFVFKLAANGSSLWYSTYIGGNNHEYGYGIALDNMNNAYVTGGTSSTDFPTVNEYETDDGGWDVYVLKLAANGSSLEYSTYVGGSSDEFGHGIAVDSIGNAYVTGSTVSTDFPTVNEYEADDGGTDVFVFKLAADGSSLEYSTYIGGIAGDEGFDIAVDSTGNAYVTGDTDWNDFPIVNEYEGDDGGSDVFVLKLAADGSSLVYSTYVGGSGGEFARGLALDNAGNVYVTGGTSSTDFPTMYAYNATGDGNYGDVFVFKLTFVSEPSPPHEVTTPISGNQEVILLWGEPMNDGNLPITTYRVYRNTSSVFDSFFAETTNEFFIDATTSSNLTYYYVITAVNSFGESGFSNEITITVPLSITYPGAPQSLSANPGDNFIDLTWTPPINDGGSAIIRYHIYRGTATGEYFFLGVTNSTIFKDTAVLGGTAYYYVVTAISAAGESTFSNEICVTPTTPATTQITTSETTTTETAASTFPGFATILFSIGTILVITQRRRKT